jgi:predicted nicotinamide N-methyase
MLLDIKNKARPQDMTQRLVFQDEVVADDNSEEEGGSSSLFFELANAAEIGFRLSDDCDGNSVLLVFRQDGAACGKHTGGILWETSYILLHYLLQLDRCTLGRTLEVGAGCGLLGTVLAAESRCSSSTMTEAAVALDNLQKNLEANGAAVSERSSGCQGRGKVAVVSACQLDWTNYERDAAKAGLKAHSFDTIVGTDVIFTPALVEPLLDTLAYFSHATTVIYLCVQVRCVASHQQFFELLAASGRYDLVLQDISQEVFGEEAEQKCGKADKIPWRRWGRELECCLFRITHRKRNKRKQAVGK